MKKTKLLGVLVLAGISACAQKVKTENVPAAVKQSFSKMYPEVKEVKWEMEDKNFEAEFKKNKEELEAVFTPEGIFVQSEKELGSTNDLPKEVLASLYKEFAGYKFSDVEWIETADKKVQYEVSAEKGELEYDLLYDKNGVLLKKTEEKEDEKKEKKD
jgi:hypothetical protein